jgi:hypothetical protein
VPALLLEVGNLQLNVPDDIAIEDLHPILPADLPCQRPTTSPSTANQTWAQASFRMHKLKQTVLACPAYVTHLHVYTAWRGGRVL